MKVKYWFRLLQNSSGKYYAANLNDVLNSIDSNKLQLDRLLMLFTTNFPTELKCEPLMKF